MIYPRFIKEGDIIGVTAPSDGNKKDIDYTRFDNGKRKLYEKGYSVKETSHVRSSEKGRSCDGSTRAREFHELILDETIPWIVSAKGGDYLMEILPHLDFDLIKKNPKWIQGFSDNTGLTYTITTNCNIATIYSNNFNDFGMEDWHEAVHNNLSLVEGKLKVQNSFSLYEDGFYDRITGFESYRLEKPVYWRNITSNSEVTMSGRMIGGCFDVLLNLVGTRFDNTVSFIEQYKDDGILWYLESFALDSESITRGLWQLKEAGWLKYAKGFIFGRPAFFREDSAISYEEAVLSVLKELKVPIILDADIGHKAPQMTIVNGSLATIHSKNGTGQIVFRFE